MEAFVKRSGVVFLLWAVVLLAALNTGRDLYYHLTYVLSITIVLSFLWTWGSIHWVELERRTRSRRSQVGRVVEERFAVRNTGFFPKLWLEVRDHSDLPGHYASRVVSTNRRPIPALRARASMCCSRVSPRRPLR